jgi:glycosyltransferase involved in cell wall biosynthesis
MPKISVVIPTYNSAKYLGEAIQSVLNQTIGDFEIIVIDDGSTDNPKEVVDRFLEPRLRYVSQENRGVSAAYNRGFKLSCGEYVTFLDADDVLLEDSLAKGLQMLESHPEVAFSYGQAHIVDENGLIYRLRKSSFLGGSALVDGKTQVKELLFLCRITSSTVMVRRNCFEEVEGFHEELSIAEDRHLYIRLAKRWPVAYIAEPLVKYRLHHNQLHKRVDPRVAEKAFLLILHEVFEDPDVASHFQPLKKKAYSYSYRRISNYAYGYDMRSARYYLRKAVRAYPQMLLQRGGPSLVGRYIVSFLPHRLWVIARNVKRRLARSDSLEE